MRRETAAASYTNPGKQDWVSVCFFKPCLKYNGLGLYHKNNRQNDTVYQDENLMLNTERVYICGHFGICSYVKLRRFQSQNLEIQRDVGEN